MSANDIYFNYILYHSYVIIYYVILDYVTIVVPVVQHYGLTLTLSEVKQRCIGSPSGWVTTTWISTYMGDRVKAVTMGGGFWAILLHSAVPVDPSSELGT